MFFFFGENGVVIYFFVCQRSYDDDFYTLERSGNYDCSLNVWFEKKKQMLWLERVGGNLTCMYVFFCSLCFIIWKFEVCGSLQSR